MTTQQNITGKVLLGTGVVMGVGMLSYWYYRYLKRDVMPEKWRRVGTLAPIHIFPVKSCAPLQLDPDTLVHCDKLCGRVEGIRDRGLMLIDDKANMITARAYPKMVLIETKMIGPTKLRFSAPGMEELELDFEKLAAEAPGKDVHTVVHSSPVDGMLCGEKYDKWFSQALLHKSSGMHLVHYPYEKAMKNVQVTMRKEPFLDQKDTGTFNDATSYMMINLASVNDLNTRTKNPVDPLQFRANFDLVMDTNEPYAEDQWSWVKIGEEAVFRVVAPCTRCILPNINPHTGERNPTHEPLAVLNKYRKWPNYASPVFGIHLGVRQSGKVKANDVVYIGQK